MNKFFVVALFALVAACAAAPTEEVSNINPITETTGTVEGHEAEKRAILYRAPLGRYYAGYPGYPVGYRYRALSPLSYLSYPDVSYYGGYNSIVI